jgi:long-subunit acyl-CoA synthetase (AMP-forming)
MYLTDNAGVMATNERSFNAIRRVKSYFRSTTGDEWLSNLPLMHMDGRMVTLLYTLRNFNAEKDNKMHEVLFIVNYSLCFNYKSL